MPLILDDTTNDQSAVLVHRAEPTFFSKSLTGNGKGRGYLSNKIVPARNAAQVTPCLQRCRDIKVSTSSGTADYEFIPMMLLDLDAVGRIKVKKIPDDAVCVSNANVPDGARVYCLVTMRECVMVVTDKDNPVTKTKTLHCFYNITMYTETGVPNEFTAEMYTEPCLNTQQFASMKNVDFQLLDDYFGCLTVYDIISTTAEIWKNGIPSIVDDILDNNVNTHYLRTLCIRLNNYAVNLADYKAIYDSVFAKRPDAIKEITEVNLNLLLNATLKTLEQNKANITTFNAKPWNGTQPKLSNEQLVAVCSTDPCCIVQAGAGTGKSTVINNRIKYLEYCGVNLNNVMVLSFTNAAADHIKDIAPNVNSKTIASMIHDIYSMNWSHNLSTLDTMLNILRATKSVSARSNTVGMSLINALSLVKKDINAGLINLSNLVSNHFDEVINILNTINQTTLELESIICYHAKNIVEPNGLCEHLIMDEVQDNSIFEFIYVINYVVRHNACLYLVGDCSQTLYEFRASNPKALNCLEMSGVFSCMQLQTNYRSNQNILDFANVTLNTIEANQFAKIQLHANNFQRNAFDSDVKVKYTQLKTKRSLEEKFPSMINEIKDWIKDKLDKHEQVAFLSYRRRDLTMFEKVIEIMFPNETLVNITPAKSFNNCFLSKYIYYYGEDFTHKAGSNVTVEIVRHIVDNIDRLCRTDQQKDALKYLLQEWQSLYKNHFVVRDVALSQGTITAVEFKEEVFQSLVDFEIEKNAMKQRLTSMANEKMKAKDISSYNFITSTIHSAKGLEFDNVILLYDESKKNEEEDKRMYYVGLTRAKSAECIIAFNTCKGSDMAETYKVMCNAQNQSSQQTQEPVNNDDGASDDGADAPVAVTI